MEKPVSNNLDGLSELIAETQERHRVVMVGHQLRFHPSFLALQRALHENSLGHLLSVRAHVGEYLPGWHPYEDYRGMYASRADLGGGVLVTQIHEFDYLYALLGLPRRVFAIGGHWSHLEIDVEDVASTLMEFQFSGRPLPVHLHQDYIQSPPSRGCEIVGDRGKFVMDLVSPSVARYDREGKLVQFTRFETFERNELYLDEIRHFLECIETRAKPVVDLNDGMWSLQMALAAKESIATGRVVELAALCDVRSTHNA
jgi:predicted dehydrogenase